MDTYSIVLLSLPVLVIIVLLWFTSKKAPKGVTLGIAVVVWIIAHAIPLQTRELVMICTSMNAAGVIGVILGIIDLLRKRKRPANMEKTSNRAGEGF